jgi:hypothetical protein
VNVLHLRRIEAIEAALDGLRTVAVAAKPAHEMTQSECVQVVYDLCHARPPSMTMEDLRPSAADAAIVAELRAIIREQHQ